MVHFVFQGVGLLVACGVGSEIIYQVYIWARNRHKAGPSETESRNVINEVLFFPDKQIACKEHFVGEDGCSNTSCRFTHKPNSLSRLYQHISSAKISLDICVFVICCADLGDLVLDAHNRGVKVRVICDDEQLEITGSQIWKLRKGGINVRTDNSPYLMHHKFVVIDRSLLVNGSFNWTRQAISGNQENLMVLNNDAIVSFYAEEFERLWTDFNPRNFNKSDLYKTDV